MKNNKVYTWGYEGKKPGHLKQILETLDAVAFDCRISPRSRNPLWNKANLENVLGDRYRHVGAWGNRNYKGGPIDIVDYTAGRAVLETETRNIVIFCVCASPERCHRSTIAAALREDGYEVEEYVPPGTNQAVLF